MKLANRTVAVTGATGFFGRFLVEKLVARGARVLAVVRDRDKACRLLPPELEVRVADLSDRSRLEAAFAGCDAVIANAAVISFRAPRLTLRTNVDGTRNVFEALAASGVRRAISISSSAAYPLALRTLDERAPLRRLGPAWFLNAYGVSKAEAERITQQICERQGIDLTVFRPCGISGPRDPLLIGAIARVMRMPVAPIPVAMRFGVAHAEDIAEAVAVALERPAASRSSTYNIQGETVSIWQVADAWEAAGGGAPRLRIPVPVPIAMRYDDSLARRELGFSPRSLHAIVREAVAAESPASSRRRRRAKLDAHP